MAINEDCVMVVMEHTGGAAPAGWTLFQTQGLIARRVLYVNANKLQQVGRKAVLINVYQANPGGSQAFTTEYAGNDSYSIEYDAADEGITAAKYNAAGGSAGTTRNAHKKGAGGTVSEFWEKTQGQVPMLGVVFQDATPTTTQLANARAIDPATVPLG